jgi:predicted DNA-binding transcriptional regulator AlpA
MTIGLKKLKEAMKTIGYKKICELTGLKRSILYDWLNGHRDPCQMAMSRAQQLKYHCGIDYGEWFLEE